MLLDAPYFQKIQQAAASMTAPPLPDLSGPIVVKEKRDVICRLDVCNAAIEWLASKKYPLARLNSDLGGIVSTEAAIKFVSQVVNRMRCGCYNHAGHSCFTTESLGALVDAAGTSLITNQVCDNGKLTPCGRALRQCNDFPDPQCVGTPNCPDVGATLEFEIPNLNKVCFEAAMTAPGSAQNLIKQDVATNMLGAIVGDFTCDCSVTVPGKVGVMCACVLKCIQTSIFTDNDSWRRLKAIADHYVVQTPNLDRVVPSCKVDPAQPTYGETTTFKVTAPQSSGANQLYLGFSLLLCCVFSLSF
jgi:hypothetical protein